MNYPEPWNKILQELEEYRDNIHEVNCFVSHIARECIDIVKKQVNKMTKTENEKLKIVLRKKKNKITELNQWNDALTDWIYLQQEMLKVAKKSLIKIVEETCDEGQSQSLAYESLELMKEIERKWKNGNATAQETSSSATLR